MTALRIFTVPKHKKPMPAMQVKSGTTALAKIKKSELITGDKEFRDVENEIKIFWLP